MLTFSGNVKPVKRHPKPDGSAEKLDMGEEKDELHSLHSFRSARTARSAHSSDTQRTHHSHSSKHSSRSMSVAFARRRQYS